jgi:type I restriction enzyme R subunit
MDFAKQLNDEERRGIREQLDDEQLAILDILTRPSPPLAKPEREQVKRLARELLDTLKAEWLVLPQVAQPAANPRCCAGRNSGSAREPAAEILRRRIHVKCEAVYQHVYDSYYGAGRSVYAVAR